MGINEKEFYKRTLLDKLSDYKASIFSIVATSVFLTLLYLLFAHKVYTTDATVEVSPKLNQLTSSMQIENSANVFARHLQTQIDFLQSRSLTRIVIDKLQANVHYYIKERLSYRRVAEELPYQVLIVVKDPDFYGKRFQIKALNEERYELRIVTDKNFFQTKFSKPLVYRFSKQLTTDYFDIVVIKNSDTTSEELYFKVYDPDTYVDRVLSNLSVVQNSEKSSIIKIVYSDTNPYSAQQYVNTLIETFLSINQQQEIAEAENLLELIDRKLKEEKEKLDKSEQMLKNYIARNKVAALGEQTSQIINMIYKYEKEIEELKIKLQNLKSVSLLFAKRYDYRSIITLVQEIGNSNLTKFIDTIAADEAEYRKLRLRYKEKHPAVAKLRHTINRKLRALSENINELLKDTRKRILELSAIRDRYKKELTVLPQKEFGFSRLKQKHNVIEKNYLYLLEKRTQVLMSKQVDGAYEYRVIDPAYVPAFASKPKVKILFLLSLILGIITAVLYALIRDYFSKYIKSPAEVEELTQLPYLGTIPYIEEKRLYNDLFVIKSPRSIATEMIWSLRAAVEDYKMNMQTSSGKNMKGMVIAVTSMVKGEGKTTTAANLALSLGIGDKKTAVVSMDTRLPELHIKFGLDNSVGITSVLFGDKTLSEVTFRPADLPGFAVIPAGKECAYPPRMINSDRLNSVLSELREKYDYIVLDLPPVGVASESLFLMKKADLVIAVLKANYSEKSFVTYMESIATKHQIARLGFVLNSVDKKYIKILVRKENIKYIKGNRYLDLKRQRKRKKSLWSYFKPS